MFHKGLSGEKTHSRVTLYNKKHPKAEGRQKAVTSPKAGGEER